MSEIILAKPGENMKDILGENDAEKLKQFLMDLSPAETARGISRLTSQEQQKLLILLSPEDAAEALSLDASPSPLGLVAGLGETIAPFTVTLRTSGDAELSWNASENIPWLSLEMTSGTTPSDLVLTFDPNLLHVGDNTGKITITSDQADNSPIEMFVTIQVTGFATYLPGILR